MNAVLLIYGIEGAELKALKALCAKKSVRAKSVLREDYAQPIGAMCGLAEKIETAHCDAALAEPVLVFAHFGEKQLDMLLSEMKTARLASGVLKAVVTKYNAQWSAFKLCQEMALERDGIGKTRE